MLIEVEMPFKSLKSMTRIKIFALLIKTVNIKLDLVCDPVALCNC